MINGPVAMTFDATTYPDPDERVAAWRDAFSLTVDVRFDKTEIEHFAGSFRYHSFGSVLLVERRYTRHAVVRSKSTIDRTGKEHLIFHFFLEGGAVGIVGGQKIDVTSGDCFMYDTRGTLQITMRAGCFVGLIMPRRLFEAAAGPIGQLHGLVLRAQGAQAGFIGQMLIALAERAGRLAETSSQALGTALIGVVGASMASSYQDAAGMPLRMQPPAQGVAAAPVATVARLRRHIERNAANPAYTPEALASAFGLSRATLYRAFRPIGGVARVIQQRRAAVALQLLTKGTSDRASLSEIARASGFQDVAGLRRAFHTVYGASPTTLQKHPVGAGTEPGPSSLAIGALYDDLPC